MKKENKPKIPWAIQLWPEYIDGSESEGILIEVSFSAMSSDTPFLNFYTLQIRDYEDKNKSEEEGWKLYYDDTEALIYRNYKGMLEEKELKSFCEKILGLLV